GPIPTRPRLERQRHERHQHHSRNHRRDQGRPHGRAGGRGRPRERRRPGHGGAVRHTRGREFHGPPRPRPDLPHAHRGALRPAQPPPHGVGQPRRHGHQFHRVHRGRHGRHHRHFRPRPRPHHPGGGGPGRQA